MSPRAVTARFSRLLSDRVALPLVLTLAVLVLVFVDWLSPWDWMIYDWNMGSWSRESLDDTVIVAIDARSVVELGRWPWSRQRHAELLQRLGDAGAKVVGFNIVFAEPDEDDPAGDAVFAQAVRDNGRVVLAVFYEQLRLGGQWQETLPMRALAGVAAGLGHVGAELEIDGITRGVFLKAGLGSAHWSALSLAMLQVAEPARGQALPGERRSEDSPSSAQHWVRDNRVLIPFAGPPGHFQRVSFVDVLRGRVPAEMFRDKYVLVGLTARGLGDAISTPGSRLHSSMPGVEIQANILDALRQGLTIRRLALPWTLLLSGALVLLATLVYDYLLPRQALLVAVVFVALTVLISMVLVRVLHLWFPPSAAVLVLASSYPLWSWRRLESVARSLFEQKEQAQVTLHSIGDAVITTNAKGTVEYMNPVAEKLTGFTLVEAKGRALDAVFRVIHEDTREDLTYPFARCLYQGQSMALPEHSVLLDRRGREYAIHASAAPMRGPTGQAMGCVVALSDVTGIRRMAQAMEHQATHDALTELPNRHLLQDRLEHAIAHAQRFGQGIAVLFIDLDNFKRVNDGLGHTAGDALLKAVAARLGTSRREEDTVARLGGDEFIVVLENLRDEDLVASVARKILKALEAPFSIDGHEVSVRASIGVSVFPKDGADVETLLKNADTAMYRAKDNGRNNVEFYAQDMNVRAVERLVMEQNLRRALEREELELHYQPFVNTQDGRITGVEALLRWRHATLGLIAPAQFVPLAEESGLIVPIGEWVIHTACRQLRAWQALGINGLRVAVNLSPRQFTHKGITKQIARCLQETGLDARSVDLEITEGVIMKDVHGAIATLRALKSMGLRLAIDDFGTGYSSLNYLRQFPIDRLKIDRSFVHDIRTNRDDAAIALAVISMAHSMKFAVTAEGVENETQVEFLRSKQCEEMQGYYFGRPMPLQAMTAMLGTAHDAQSAHL